MSTALLFDLDEVAPVRAPAPPPPSAPAVRRRLTVVEQPALPLPEPEVKEPPTKADAQQLYHWRSGKVSLALLGEAPGRYDVDRFEMTHGECMVQRRRCRFTDCDHHLGGVRKFEHPDYPNRRYTFSCALAVARHFPKGLAPKYVAELLGTTESEVQAVEIYAVKSLQAALDTDGEQADALWEAKAALDEWEELPEPEEPSLSRAIGFRAMGRRP